MSDRDLFLTEIIIGGARVPKPSDWSCDADYAIQRSGVLYCSQCSPDDFSTWEGFGKLWTWAKEQEWWGEFKYDNSRCGVEIYVGLINPDTFANAIHEYLKDKP